MSVSSWEPDPTGRHQYRWWDGEEWTDQVVDDGVQTTDPVTSSEASLPEGTLPSTLGPAPNDPIVHNDPDTPDPMRMLSARGKRFGAFLLEIPLAAVTLGIGYLIWALIVYSQGQTPAKQLLKMRVVNLDERRAAGWSSMFLREWILKAAIPIGLNLISVGIVGILWILVGGIMVLVNDRHRALWDRALKTVVIDDPDDSYKPHPYSRDRLWEQ
ncbi:MAG: RDD family protein [bacterium]|nr:RDD family protein [bacterium]